MCVQNKTINHEIKEIIISDSGYVPHIVNRLRNMMNLREVKTVLKKENNNNIMGSLQGD